YVVDSGLKEKVRTTFDDTGYAYFSRLAKNLVYQIEETVAKPGYDVTSAEIVYFKLSEDMKEAPTQETSTIKVEGKDVDLITIYPDTAGKYASDSQPLNNTFEITNKPKAGDSNIGKIEFTKYQPDKT